MMRSLLILGLLAWPVAAAAQSDTDDGIGLVERGLGIIADNLWNEFGPQLNELGQGMGGALEDLAVLVDDLGNYQAPERLENGDIVIRRKPGAPPPPPLGVGEPDGPGAPQVPIDPDQPEIPL